MAREVQTVFSSAARATATSVPQNNTGFKGGTFILNITAVTGTNPTLDLKLQMLIPGTSTGIDIPGAAFAQKTTTGTAALTVYPGAAETTNVSVSDILPATYVAVGTVGGTDTPLFTYTLHASLVD